MTRIVALLAGVNVGGSRRLAMADLRAAAEQVGLTGVSTYIQSGNLVATTDLDPGAVESELASALSRHHGLDTVVFARTASQWAALTTANPFLDLDEDLTHHHLVLTDEPAGLAGGLEPAGDEQIGVGEAAVYLYLPHGVARSRMAAAATRRGRASMRNWRTVERLGQML